MKFDTESRQELDLEFDLNLAGAGGPVAEDEGEGEGPEYDEELVDEIQARCANSGPIAAETYSFEELCLPWMPALRDFAGRLLRNKDAAGDLVQDAMCKALLAWPRWRPVGYDVEKCARSWLFLIVKNTFVNQYHKDRYKRARAQDHAYEILASTYGTYRDGLDPREDDLGISDEVKAAVGKLEPKHREMIERHDFAGEMYADIATDMKVPIGTVMSGLHRARKRLAVELKGYARREYRIERTGQERENAPAVEAESASP